MTNISDSIQGWENQQIYLSAQRKLISEKYFLLSQLTPAFVIQSALTKEKQHIGSKSKGNMK